MVNDHKMLKLLKETWKEIGFLLAVAGGFWGLLQPPIGAHPEAYTGFVGSAVLAAALGVRATLNVWGAKPWVIPVVLSLALVSLIAAVGGFYVYVPDRSSLVFTYEVDVGNRVEVIRGTEYQPHIAAIKQKSVLTDEDLLGEAGGIDARELVWTRASLDEAERHLAGLYMLTALTTLLSIMFSLEVLRMWMQKKE